jgi:hypothetical protein
LCCSAGSTVNTMPRRRRPRCWRSVRGSSRDEQRRPFASKTGAGHPSPPTRQRRRGRAQGLDDAVVGENVDLPSARRCRRACRWRTRATSAPCPRRSAICEATAAEAHRTNALQPRAQAAVSQPPEVAGRSGALPGHPLHVVQPWPAAGPFLWISLTVLFNFAQLARWTSIFGRSQQIIAAALGRRGRRRVRAVKAPRFAGDRRPTQRRAGSANREVAGFRGSSAQPALPRPMPR